MNIETKQFCLTNRQKEKLLCFFEKESDYRYHLNNLYATRKGLYTILEVRPELNNVIQDQFHTINNLIGVLLFYPGEYPYPPYNRKEK